MSSKKLEPTGGRTAGSSVRYAAGHYKEVTALLGKAEKG